MKPRKHGLCLSILIFFAVAGSNGCGVVSDNEKVTKAGACSESTNGCVDGRLLHVPSPDWRDQIIYFLMIDRFNDGDPLRNDQGYGLYDPSKESHYSGGDLQGVIDQLDYIQNIGATTLWTTPPVANQWWNEAQGYGGFHGYWPIDHRKIDEHFGDLETYKNLSHELHNRGMYLIHDVVINHTGNYFDYNNEYDPNDPSVGFEFVSNSVPPSAPTMPPLHMNNANNPEHVKAGIYHWTPLIVDLDDPVQESTYQMGRLDDINTSNPQVRKAFKDVYNYWITETGVDAYRIDTVKYVEHDFWNDFFHADDGILQTALATGRDNFLTFGEVKDVSKPMSDLAERKLLSYLGSEAKPELSSAIGFPLHEELGRIFAGGRPTSWLTFRVNAHLTVYPNPYIVPNFIDNHDTPRFPGSEVAMKQALALIFTIPGIPVIYQGNEQNHVDSRQAMFAGGYLTDADQFNQQSELYQFIQALAQLRQSNKIFSRGSMELLQDNPTGAGIFAYKRSYNDEQAFVIMNTAEHATLLNRMPTGLPSGQVLEPIFRHGNNTSALVVGPDGFLIAEVPARGVLILKAAGQSSAQVNTPHRIRVDQDYSAQTLKESAILSGSVSKPNGTLALVIDGNLENSISVTADENGNWQTLLPAVDLGFRQRFFEMYSAELNVTSERQQYSESIELANWDVRFSDPLNDDHGRTGKLFPPTESTFGKQMDIEAVQARSAGDTLLLDITMHELTDMWVASNHLDHVAFTIFLDFPGSEGITPLSLLQADAPENFKWDFSHVLYGWGNFLFSSDGASAEQPGRKLGSAPDIKVDKGKRTITIEYSARALGQNKWAGSKIYITTWDRAGEGGIRTLSPEGAAWEFGGGEPNEPLILDELLIELPNQ
ncbi:alpha-amylase [Alteromonas aestuariivivens]|uniref:Alpha-amylase n=1 Tax=Alteromonas aestuariivivens TaxID=1938339 RepID=A0A3D8M4A1_9ALTE|nr:alpha-amylase family glycosyl hydrolase [Alteromonas aestuariivivens]RDV24519.1 alpha-amylase [Alteromonas aestuariivivens]